MIPNKTKRTLGQRDENRSQRARLEGLLFGNACDVVEMKGLGMVIKWPERCGE